MAGIDAAGLGIAVFNEVFIIGKFIRQVLIDARDQNNCFRRLESDFEYQQTLLSTFGKLFLKSRVIYEIEDGWRDQINKILGGLQRLFGEYSSLAARYDKAYAKTLEGDGERWEIGNGSPGKRNGAEAPKVVDLEPIKAPGEKKSTRDGWGAKFSRGFASLEWALSNKAKLESLVHGHKVLVKRLMEVMKLTLSTRPLWSDMRKLRDFQQENAKAVGMLGITTTRMFILDPSLAKAIKLDTKRITAIRALQEHHKSRTGAAPLIGEGDLRNGRYNDQDVLIEYKRYPDHHGPDILERARRRIKLLSSILNVACHDGEPTRSSNFTLRCLGFFDEPKKRRHGLMFALPHRYGPDPTSLYAAIHKLTKQLRPTLGQRFTIAYSIGYTLIEWLLVGWVHKGINSKNVLFFRPKHQKSGKPQELDLDSPYLCGFEYARPAGIYSIMERGHEREMKGLHWDVYRHPARQGLPSEMFGTIHDIYAFGVLLLELGLWQLAPTLFERGASTTPAKIHETLVKNAQDRLGHHMGQKYRDAVLLCLKGSIAVDLDDKMDSKLVAAFKEKVVDILEEGRKL